MQQKLQVLNLMGRIPSFGFSSHKDRKKKTRNFKEKAASKKEDQKSLKKIQIMVFWIRLWKKKPAKNKIAPTAWEQFCERRTGT